MNSAMIFRRLIGFFSLMVLLKNWEFSEKNGWKLRFFELKIRDFPLKIKLLARNFWKFSDFCAKKAFITINIGKFNFLGVKYDFALKNCIFPLKMNNFRGFLNQKCWFYLKFQGFSPENTRFCIGRLKKPVLFQFSSKNRIFGSKIIEVWRFLCEKKL